MFGIDVSLEGDADAGEEARKAALDSTLRASLDYEDHSKEISRWEQGSDRDIWGKRPLSEPALRDLGFSDGQIDIVRYLFGEDSQGHSRLKAKYIKGCDWSSSDKGDSGVYGPCLLEIGKKVGVDISESSPESRWEDCWPGYKIDEVRTDVKEYLQQEDIYTGKGFISDA